MLRIGQVESTAQNGKYTDGNVAGGVAATRLRAAAFNALQEELANFIESAGIQLDVNDTTQLLAALKKLSLARSNPFADIKADGAAAVASALSNLGLGEAAKRAVGTGANQIPDMSSWASGTGWRRTPDGTIEQWGRVNTPTADISYPVIFPIPFTNIEFNLSCTYGYPGARVNDNVTAQALAPTLTGFNANRQDIYATSVMPDSYIYWRAIGK